MAVPIDVKSEEMCVNVWTRKTRVASEHKTRLIKNTLTENKHDFRGHFWIEYDDRGGMDTSG